MKSNALNGAEYTINLVAQRVILMAIIEAREQSTILEAGGVLRITASEYRKHFGCEKTTPYRALKSACESLYEADFVWTDTDEHGKKKVNKSRFVQRASYSEGGGYIEVMFGNDVIPLITRLSERYTEYDLSQISDLNSIHALRIFELLMQWRGKGITPTIKLDDLRVRLGIEEDQYKLMSNFKSRVLDYAINEINENTEINVQYEQEKHGRTIIGFKFKFKFKKKGSNKAKTPQVERSPDNGDMFTIDGLSDAQLGRIARSPQFCRDYAESISPSNPINQDMNLWAVHFVDELKKNSSQFNKRPIRDYLDY